MTVRPLFAALLCACLCAAVHPAHAVVFTNDTTIASDNTDYEGHPIVVSNCTLTVRGPHSFGNGQVVGGSGIVDCGGTNTFSSLLVQTGTTYRVQGAAVLSVTGTLTIRTNGTVEVRSTNHTAQVAGGWAGVGGTITAGDATIDAGGMITADGQGYQCPTWGTGTGPGGGGVGNGSGGGGHGGRGGRTRYLGAGGSVYGSSVFPLGLGSSAGGAPNRSGDGGGAIRL